MAAEDAHWTVLIPRDECILRVRSAGGPQSAAAGMRATFLGRKVLSVEVKNSVATLSGRYGTSWTAKGFLTLLEVRCEDLDDGRTAISCRGRLAVLADWFFRFWIGVISFALCLIVGAYLFDPVKSSLGQFVGSIVALGVMMIFGLGMRRLMMLVGTGEQAYLMDALRAALGKPPSGAWRRA